MNSINGVLEVLGIDEVIDQEMIDLNNLEQSLPIHMKIIGEITRLAIMDLYLKRDHEGKIYSQTHDSNPDEPFHTRSLNDWVLHKMRAIYIPFGVTENTIRLLCALILDRTKELLEREDLDAVRRLRWAHPTILECEEVIRLGSGQNIPGFTRLVDISKNDTSLLISPLPTRDLKKQLGKVSDDCTIEHHGLSRRLNCPNLSALTQEESGFLVTQPLSEYIQFPNDLNGLLEFDFEDDEKRKNWMLDRLRERQETSLTDFENGARDGVRGIEVAVTGERYSTDSSFRPVNSTNEIQIGKVFRVESGYNQFDYVFSLDKNGNMDQAWANKNHVRLHKFPMHWLRYVWRCIDGRAIINQPRSNSNLFRFRQNSPPTSGRKILHAFASQPQMLGKMRYYRVDQESISNCINELQKFCLYKVELE